MSHSLPHLAVIIPAAGSGSRMAHSVPKPLIRLHGMSILERTIRKFFFPGIAEMLIPVSDAVRVEAETLCRHLDAPFPVRLIEGGAQRQDSVWNALQALDAQSGIIVIHDAARPFFDPALIAQALPLLERHAGVIAALPAVHTMKEVEKGIVRRTPERSTLWQVNTPQLFRREPLLRAYREAIAAGFYGTDDAMLLERIGESVAVIQDSPFNIKITTSADLLTAERILNP
ncbi:MAG: 2-C-methyl-D-erythritol 4-phosphate cytidylyltransferase [Candidatus Marinimicrobia bacterium]|nr:2-C-methyl-D-erythritol 4-phosphate cytidylyltransferase [Candidatus Neomarinimicrobiota bacterium]